MRTKKQLNAISKAYSQRKKAKYGALYQAIKNRLTPEQQEHLNGYKYIENKLKYLFREGVISKEEYRNF